MPKCQIMSQFGGQEQTTTADILIYMVIVFLSSDSVDLELVSLCLFEGYTSERREEIFKGS